jgi:peptide/nickel transport system permease protein
MLNERYAFLVPAPWMSVFLGLASILASLSSSLVDDGLRDVLGWSLR